MENEKSASHPKMNTDDVSNEDLDHCDSHHAGISIDNEPQALCIICKTREGTSLKAFDDKTWVVVKKAAEWRLLLKTDRYRETTTDINLQTGRGNAMYHPKPCYKNFTAVKKRSTLQSPDEPPLKKHETRRRSSLPQTDENGLLKGTCIFCGKERKTINQTPELLSDCLTTDGCQKIMKGATRSTNERIKALVGSGVDLIAKHGQYHKSCRREFLKEIEEPQLQKSHATTRQLHADTFSTIAALVEKEVIINQQAMLVSSLFDLYKAEFIGSGGTEEEIYSYTTQALGRKIKDKFQDKITISLLNSRRGNFLYSSAFSEADAREGLLDEREKRQTMIRRTALLLRNEIKKMPSWTTPSPTSVETLKTCSPDLPDDLTLFFRTLICGLREPTGQTNKDNVERKVTAMSSDAVFNATRGSVRPWKQTALGLGLGTLTGSKLIIRILNRLGYSLSYDEVKALETEFAFSTEENDHETPDGIELKPNLATGLAWDNYDVNMETLDGKNTLHATVGICYQNETSENNMDSVPITTHSRRSRRHFQGKESTISPVRSQLRKANFDLLSTDEERETCSAVTQRKVDFYWLMMFQMRPQPLFAGFFSQFIQNNLPKQKICYMDPILASPTRNDVVRETMKRSMRVAFETQQSFAVVTYDLAIALKAYSIQSLEAPLFDRLLILLGNFHIELAFYGAVGTYINESGAEHLLTECGILAEGSLNGFIRGKYYNRCSRVHEILALVMERKLYESFLSTIPQESKDALNTWLQDAPTDCSEMESFLEEDELFRNHKEQYEEYFDRVMKGALGPTAQYWCGYVFLINRVHRDLMRALQSNDITSYLTILPKVIDVFFALNRPNYARWGVLFLTKLETADPEIRTILEKGAFSIRRTSTSSSGTAIDLTLEQTINRDAASPMRGIVAFHNSSDAMRRWCITSTQRGMAVTELRRLTGLIPEEQPKTQLRPDRVKKDSIHAQSLYKALTETCDPFKEPASTSPCLLNIATGKGASDVTQKYLIESLSTGNKLHKTFLEECVKDNARLVKPIKRRKVNNFASENTNPKRSGSKVTTAVKDQRDRFIRMLVVISKHTHFDLEHVVSYPITDVPLSIAQPDGSLLKTEKSKLMHKLESMQDGVKILPHIEATLIDGGLLLHSYLSAIGKISSYGKLARDLLVHVFSSIAVGKEVHILFDKYLPTSLKENERRLRGAEDHPFMISGSEQGPKENCQNLLQNGIFKDQLAIFLLEEWQRDHYGPILGKKTLIVSHGGRCLRIAHNEINCKTTVDYPSSLQGDHEEADTLVAFHSACVDGSQLIRASDTDVLIILLGMLGREALHGTPLKPIIMDCGSGNNRRYLDLTSIAKALEKKHEGLSAALPGLHAFTGCDFTSSFYRKGKIRPYELLENDNDGTFIQFFNSMSARTELSPQISEEYVCSLYGMKGLKDVNEARYNKLVQMTGKIDQKDPLSNIKKVDCALLPPCAKSLWHKTQRAHYIGIIWGNADSKEPAHGLDPQKYGWKVENGHFTPDWFLGPAMPDDIFKSHPDSDRDRITTDDEEETDSEEGELDTNSEYEWSDDMDSEDDA